MNKICFYFDLDSDELEFQINNISYYNPGTELVLYYLAKEKEAFTHFKDSEEEGVLKTLKFLQVYYILC